MMRIIRYRSVDHLCQSNLTALRKPMINILREVINKERAKSQQLSSFFVLPWKDSELYTAINEFECDYQ